jgi:hypothetical protein
MSPLTRSPVASSGQPPWRSSSAWSRSFGCRPRRPLLAPRCTCTTDPRRRSPPTSSPHPFSARACRLCAGAELSPGHPSCRTSAAACAKVAYVATSTPSSAARRSFQVSLWGSSVTSSATPAVMSETGRKTGVASELLPLGAGATGAGTGEADPVTGPQRRSGAAPDDVVRGSCGTAVDLPVGAPVQHQCRVHRDGFRAREVLREPDERTRPPRRHDPRRPLQGTLRRRQPDLVDHP